MDVIFIINFFFGFLMFQGELIQFVMELILLNIYIYCFLHKGFYCFCFSLDIEDFSDLSFDIFEFRLVI